MMSFDVMYFQWYKINTSAEFVQIILIYCSRGVDICFPSCQMWCEKGYECRQSLGQLPLS